MSWKWRNWCHNEVDEEIEGIDSRDKMKRNKKSDQLLLDIWIMSVSKSNDG